jgi:hypothetical protein
MTVSGELLIQVETDDTTIYPINGVCLTSGDGDMKFSIINSTFIQFESYESNNLNCSNSSGIVDLQINVKTIIGPTNVTFIKVHNTTLVVMNRFKDNFCTKFVKTEVFPLNICTPGLGNFAYFTKSLVTFYGESSCTNKDFILYPGDCIEGSSNKYYTYTVKGAAANIVKEKEIKVDRELISSTINITNSEMTLLIILIISMIFYDIIENVGVIVLLADLFSLIDFTVDVLNIYGDKYEVVWFRWLSLLFIILTCTIFRTIIKLTRNRIMTILTSIILTPISLVIMTFKVDQSIKRRFIISVEVLFESLPQLILNGSNMIIANEVKLTNLLVVVSASFLIGLNMKEFNINDHETKRLTEDGKNSVELLSKS